MLNQQTPSLGALLAEAIDARLVDVHTHLPARIETYDAVKQLCSVQIELRQAAFFEDGERVAELLPVISNVPVMFLRGGGFHQTCPLQRGDRVLLCIAEGCIDGWKQNGGDTDPQLDRRFNLSDAYAIPGGYDFAHPIPGGAPTDRMSLGSDTGTTVNIDNNEVRLGDNSASDHVALVTDIATTLKGILTDPSVKSGIAAASTDGGTSYATAITTLFAAATFGATKVKAK